MLSDAHAPEELLGSAIAQLKSETFPVTLHAWIRSQLDADNATFLAFFQSRKPELLFLHARDNRVHDRIETDYLSGSYLLDPFHELHVSQAPKGLYRLRDFAPDHFTRNEYFAAYYRRTTLIDEIAFVSYPAPGVSVHLCLGRDASSGRIYSSGDMKTAQKISAIACALSENHWSELKSSGDYKDDSLLHRMRDGLLHRHGIRLSPRQTEVALMILRGHSSLSIGLRLGISPQTVKVFRKQLYRKCAISSQGELFSLLMPLLSD